MKKIIFALLLLAGKAQAGVKVSSQDLRPAISSGSSANISGTFTTSGAGISVCNASTMTFTIPPGSAGNVLLGLNGSFATTAVLGNGWACDFLVDGQFQDGADAAQSNSTNCQSQDIGANDTTNFTCLLPVFGLAPGVHNVCIACSCGGSGTCTIRNGAGFPKSKIFNLNPGLP